MGINEFRQKLDDITNGNQRPSIHPRLIESLKKDYPHSIRIISNPNCIDTREDCFSYAFKNILPTDIFEIVKILIDNNLFEKAINELISNGFLLLHDVKEEYDKIVVYFNKEYAKHFGEIKNNKIISKWGKTHLYKHELFEIPLSYGSSVKYSNGKINEIIFQEIIKKDYNKLLTI